MVTVEARSLMEENAGFRTRQPTPGRKSLDAKASAAEPKRDHEVN